MNRTEYFLSLKKLMHESKACRLVGPSAANKHFHSRLTYCRCALRKSVNDSEECRTDIGEIRHTPRDDECFFLGARSKHECYDLFCIQVRLLSRRATAVFPVICDKLPRPFELCFVGDDD